MRYVVVVVMLKTFAFLLDIQYEWSNRSPYKSTILIATDRDLGELKLNSVTNIIHFDLPILGSDAFGERHLGMWNLFPFLGKEDNSSKVRK